MLSPQIYTRFELNKNDQAISDRFLFNSFAFEMIKKSPFMGVGIGNFVLNVNSIKNLPSKFDISPFIKGVSSLRALPAFA